MWIFSKKLLGSSKRLWLCNHKDIGTYWLITGAWGGIIGTGLRIIIWIELGQPGSLIGDDQIYNVIVTAHAFIIIFFIIIPILIGGFGNWLISLILDTPTIAFPRFNNIRFWFLFPALLRLIRGVLIQLGVDIRWTNIPLIRNIALSLSAIDFSIFYLFLVGVSLFLGTINIVLCLYTFINKSQFYLLLHLFFLLFSIILMLMYWTKYRVILSHKWQVSASSDPLYKTRGLLWFEDSIWYFCYHNQWVCGHSFSSWDELEAHQLLGAHNHNSIRNYNLPLRDSIRQRHNLFIADFNILPYQRYNEFGHLFLNPGR